MTECTTTKGHVQSDLFPSLKHRKMKIDFHGGNVSSDGGVLLLKQILAASVLLSLLSLLFQNIDRDLKLTYYLVY